MKSIRKTLNSKYLIKDFCQETTPEDVYQLMQNKHRTSGKKIKREFFHKKYSRSYYNDNPLVSKLIYFNNSAVAHVGAFPMTAVVNKKTYPILQIGDIITHSDHTGKGLFSELMKAIIADAKEKDYTFLFVVPNASALPIFINKFKWQKTQENVIFSLKIKTFFLNKVINKIKLIPLYEKLFDSVNKKYLINRDIENSPTRSNNDQDRIFKDSGFYNYKTYAKNYLYKFNNGDVWLKLDDGILIGDFQIQKLIEDLMLELSLFAKKRGIHNLKIHQSISSPYYNYFKKRGYTEHDSLPVLTYRIDQNIDLSNWLTCMADYNTF